MNATCPPETTETKRVIKKEHKHRNTKQLMRTVSHFKLIGILAIIAHASISSLYMKQHAQQS